MSFTAAQSRFADIVYLPTNSRATLLYYAMFHPVLDLGGRNNIVMSNHVYQCAR